MGIDAKVKKNGRALRSHCRGTTGIRTWDTRIFSPLLYQLSYGTKRATAKINKFSCQVRAARPSFPETVEVRPTGHCSDWKTKREFWSNIMLCMRKNGGVIEKNNVSRTWWFTQRKSQRRRGHWFTLIDIMKIGAFGRREMCLICLVLHAKRSVL